MARPAKSQSKSRGGTASRSTAATKRSAAPSPPRTRKPADGAELATRKAVIETALEMSRSRLSPGRSGNVSARWRDGMLITPSGMAYELLKPADIVFVAADGTWSAKARKPSSEWRFHLSAYAARAEAGAVVHTHSLHATVIACAGLTIPAFHYMVAVAGGKDIPCIPYATFGTEELAELVADGLKSRNACLMANHGQIAIGPDLPAALGLAQEVETIAAQYAKLLALGLDVVVLSSDEMSDVLERFKGYGQNAQN